MLRFKKFRGMIRPIGVGYIIGFLLVTTSTWANTRDMAAENLIKSIIASERDIKNVQARIVCRIPAKNNKIFYEYYWGYELGKEFYSGKEYRSHISIPVNMDTGQNTESKLEKAYVGTVKLAFDGDKIRLLRSHEDTGDTAGRIGSLDPTSFRTLLTPNTLLGFDAKEASRESFGEALFRAQSVSVLNEPQNIDNHECQILEAIGVETDPETGAIYDIRAWIDTRRGFRPLRIEKCYSIPGKNRWKVVIRRIDNIKLTQIDGVWFPIQGERTTYSVNKSSPPPGMSKAKYKALSRNDRRRLGEFAMAPIVPTRVLAVDSKSLRINQHIPKEAFSIKFPHGCRVWDEFMQMGYVIGETPKMPETLELLADMNPSSLAVAELTDGSDTLEKINNTHEHTKNPIQGVSSRQADTEKQQKIPQPLVSVFTLSFVTIILSVVGVICFFILRGLKRSAD